MIPTTGVIIFPKEDSYKYRSEEFKYEFRMRVRKIINKYVTMDGLKFNYFAEDELAQTLLPEFIPEERMTPITCLNSMDKVLATTWLSKNYSYVGAKAAPCNVDIIKECTKKCRLTESEKFEGKDAVNVNAQRLLMKKRRMIVSKFLMLPYRFVIYFNGNNQYCSLADCKLGDCRLIHIYELKTEKQEYWYSGQDLTEDLYFSVLKEGLNNG